MKITLKYVAFIIALLLLGCTGDQKVSPGFVPVQNGQIEFYRLGKGSPVVLVPGYMTDISSWDKRFVAALAAQHEVILVNNRNVGRSTIHSLHYDPDDLANDISQLIQYLHLKKPAVIGISMGGMIAQQLAVSHPDQIGQLILINTAIAGHRSLRPNKTVENKMLNLPTNKIGLAMVGMELFFPPSWRMKMAYAIITQRFLPKDYVEINLSAIKHPQQRLIMHWVNDDMTAAKLEKLTLPVLILNGEADAVLPPENSEILKRTFKNARLVRWREGGHAMVFQYPDEMANAINQFLS